MPIFKEILILPKMAAILNFRIFAQKLQNTKNANISKTVLYRTILTKFLIFRVSLQSSYPKELSLGEVLDP